MALAVIGSSPVIYPSITSFKINTLLNLIIKKQFKKHYTIIIPINELKVFSFNTLFFFKFVYSFLNLKKKTFLYKNNINLHYIFLLNLIDRQPKVNLLNLLLIKKNIFTIGLILKILNLFKKCSRRSIPMLKYVLNFLFKKYSNDFYNKKIMLTIKGLKKNYIKIIYFLKFLINKFNINFFYINPVKTFTLIKIKKIRSIKRRIRKKLINFNKI